MDLQINAKAAIAQKQFMDKASKLIAEMTLVGTGPSMLWCAEDGHETAR